MFYFKKNLKFIFYPLKKLMLFFSKNPTKTTKKILQKQQKKNISKEFFENLRYPEFRKTPVLLIFLILIFIISIIQFVLWNTPSYNPENFKEWPIHTVLFAVHPESILTENQYWRLFTYAFAGNFSKGAWFNWIISIILIWIVFARIGYFQETLIGSKKTAFLWISTILIVGFLQIIFIRNNKLYFHGIEYLSWTIIGSLVYMRIFNCNKNEQLKILLNKTLTNAILILCACEIFKINQIPNDELVLKTVYSSFLLIITMSFLLGFFLPMLYEYKKLPTISRSLILIFFAIIIIIIIFMLLWRIFKENPTNSPHEDATKINEALKSLSFFS